jgi:hypothetical protein
MIDYDELETELKVMTPRSRLYQVLKKHLSLQGRWKASKRGKPFVKGSDERRGKL